MATPEKEAGKGAGAGHADPLADAPAGGGASGTNPFGMSEWLRTMPNGQIHPLMQHPVAAMAAATAIGLDITGRIAGFMLEAMQGLSRPQQKADEAEDGHLSGEVSETVEETKPVQVLEAEKASEPAAELVEAAPVPAYVVKTEKPVRGKATTRTAGSKKPKVDDLKKIGGIGPKLEQVLNGKGVRSYRDIAAWTEADVQRFDGELGFGGRIVRDNWVEQAKVLLKG
ncbi:NADH:ubiquinone oxidoreductase [Pararhizobium gei]|uniref:NADH:ubiquinone oxidoreductase n=1 Tax=Pararhizobium gei TaxID=1395951 RepID=UPI0023DCD86A|nr:NADH:ubiquinone oxidoreductase [Rhizobium gei]